MSGAVFGGSTKPSLTWMLPVAWVELRVETRFVENNCGENNPVSLHTRKGKTRDGEHWGASHGIDIRAPAIPWWRAAQGEVG